MQLDHSSTLVGEATRFHESGDDDFAVMLCATQIEHWLNYMIMWGCTRHHDMERDEAKKVIRQSNLHVKTGWLWRLLYQEWMRADLVARIGAVADRRNAFVHYKWESFDPDIDDKPKERLAALAADAFLIIEELNELEDHSMFGGRREAIAQAMGRPPRAGS